MFEDTLHTGLYTDNSLKLFKLLQPLFADTWMTPHMRRSVRRLDYTERAPDGEVVVGPSTKNYTYESPLWSKSNKEILKWFAIHMKLAVKSKNAWSSWSRQDFTPIRALSADGLNVTVADVYFIYDFLLGRKKLSRHYKQEMIDKWVGHQADPVTASVEQARRDELKNLEQSRHDQKNNAYSKMKQNITDYNIEQQKLYDAECAAIDREIDQKIKALNESIGITSHAA